MLVLLLFGAGGAARHQPSAAAGADSTRQPSPSAAVAAADGMTAEEMKADGAPLEGTDITPKRDEGVLKVSSGCGGRCLLLGGTVGYQPGAGPSGAAYEWALPSASFPGPPARRLSSSPWAGLLPGRLPWNARAALTITHQPQRWRRLSRPTQALPVYGAPRGSWRREGARAFP